METRRLWNWLVAAVAAIVILVALALGALHTPPGRRFVLSKVTAILAQNNVLLDARDLRFNLFNLSLDVQDVSIRSGRRSSDPPFAVIQRLRANLGLLDLLRGRYVLQSATIDGARICYLVDADGENLPRPPTDPQTPSAPLNYLIAKLTASAVEFQYEDRVRNISGLLPVENLTVTGDRITGRHTIVLTAERGEARIDDREVFLDRLAMNVGVGDEEFQIAQIALDAEGAHVEVSGTVKRSADLVLDLKTKLTVDLGRAAQLARVEERLAGRVSLEATATGPASAPSIEARVQGSDVAFRSLQGLSLDADVNYDAALKRVIAHDVKVNAPWARVAVNGQLFLSQGTSEVDARLDGVDLATLMRTLNQKTVVASRLNGRGKFSWPALDVAAASGSAEVTLSPTRSGVRPSGIPLAGRLTVRGDGRQVVADVSGLAGAGLQVNGHVVLRDSTRLQGRVRATVADVATTLSAAEHMLERPANTFMSERVTGSISADAVLDGTLSRPIADIAVSAPAVQIGAGEPLALQGGLRYTPAVLGVTTLDLHWGEATAHAAGRIGLGGREPIDLSFDVDQLDVPKLVSLSGQARPTVRGVISLHGAVSGTASAPRISATVQGIGLEAASEVLGNLTSTIVLWGDELTVDQLVLDKPQAGGNGRLTVSGTYNLAQRSFTYNVGSTGLRIVGASLPDGRRVTGAIAIEGEGAGTVDAPAGALRANATDLTVGDRALGAITVTAMAANAHLDIAATAGTFGLRSTAAVELVPSYPTNVEARVTNLDLARLPITLSSPLEGDMSATVTATLELSRPALARVNASIDALSGRWNGQPFGVQEPARIALANEEIAIEHLTLTAQDSSVSVHGTLPTNVRHGQGDLAIDAHADLAALARYVPSTVSLTAAGTVQLAGRLRGNLECIDPDLQLTFDNVAATTPALGAGVTDLNASVRVVDGALTVEQLTGHWAGASLTASGIAPLNLLPALPVEIPRRGGPASIKASLIGLDPATIPGAPEGVSGTISLEVDASADRPDLSALTAAVTFPELRIAFRDLELAQQQPSVIGVRGGVAEVEHLQLAGSAGHLNGRGTVGLSGPRPVDLHVDGEFNTAIVSSFTKMVRTEGTASLNVTAAGTVSQPNLSGAMTLVDVDVVSDEPRIVAEQLNARVELAGDRVALRNLSGALNGGALTGSGGFAYRNGELEDVNVQLKAEGFAFDAPLDLRSVSNVTIVVTEQRDELVVNGEVRIREAGLTGDVNFDTGLLATLDQPRSLDLTEERNRLLERLNLNIHVVTDSPILVDNNLAHAEVRTNLRVVGTPYEIGMSGSLTVAEGGEITLNERRYQVDRATITFLEERRIVPSFDLHLNTTAGNYAVTVAVTGEPGDTETTLTADPTLPEPDIMALLVTGRTLDEMRGAEGDIATEQVLSYLTGRVGSELGRSIERATGLSEVRLEPNLIANETNPSARLTVAQELTDELRLVYSTDLTNSNDQVWVARYDVTRRFQTNVVRQPDNSFRFDFRHDVRFGGLPSPRRTPRLPLVVSAIDIQVRGQGVSEAELRDRIGYHLGDHFDYFKARDRVEDIQMLLEERGYLQSRVRLERAQMADGIALALKVDVGPVVRIAYEGVRPGGKTEKEVRRQWNRGVFDSQRASDAEDTLREGLIKQRYLAAEVRHRIEDQPDGAREVTFTVKPGTHFTRIELEFPGASGIAAATLDSIVEEQHLERTVFTDPIVVTELLRKYYREEGYLTAELDKPTYIYDGQIGRAVIQIREGPRFTVRDVTVKGNSVLDSSLLLRDLPVLKGDPFLPRAAQAALERTRDLYWKQAYNDVRSEYSTVLDRQAGTVDVTFTIVEGPKSVIAELHVGGNQRTSDRLVGEQLEIKAGQPLDLAALGRSRRNLYDTGAFSMVDITHETVATEGDTKPVRLNVNLREVQPFQLRYGASYDTERGVGGIVDVSNHNTFGKARVIGLSARYDRNVREGRASMSQPSLRYWPISTTASIYYREERSVQTTVTEAFNVDRYGVSFLQERKLRHSYVWTSGYRYERARRLTAVPGSIPETISVSPVTATLTRETRDEMLDATQGSFTSHSLSYSPTWLGADSEYVQYFGQYFHYIPLQPERRKRFTNEILRPRLVFATGIRLGLSRGFGSRVPQTERFYAGGSTTLRGLEQNSAGPIVLGIATGGDALIILNNELRFPLVGIVDGVTFLDVGNVFDHLTDLNLSQLRRTGGFGLRLRTPWFLVRGDYGLVLDRRAGEPRSQVYFSIGQAF